MANALATNRIHSNNRIMIIGLLAATSVYGLILYMHFAPQSAGDTSVCIYVCVCVCASTYLLMCACICIKSIGALIGKHK